MPGAGPRVRSGFAGSVAGAALFVASPGVAQQAEPTAPLAVAPRGGEAENEQVRSPVLTIDTDRLFRESQFGQRILSDLGEETEALAAENRRIEAELKEEERRLTEQRPQMDVATFREEADAFDCPRSADSDRSKTPRKPPSSASSVKVRTRSCRPRRRSSEA